MMAATSGASTAGARVLELLRLRDLDALCKRTENMSITQSVDFLLPTVSTLASAPDADRAGGDLQAALGVVLYQCLVQQRIAGWSVDAAIERAVAGDYKRPRELEPGIPKALEAVIARTLREPPEERFASLRELAAALLPFASTPVQKARAAELGSSATPAHIEPEPPETHPAAESPPARRPSDFKLLAAFAAILLPVVLALRGAHDKDERPAEPRTAEAAQQTAQAAALPAPAHAQAEPKPAAQPAPDAPAVAPAQRAPAAAAPGAYAVDLSVDPTTAWIMLDGKPAGSGRLRRVFTRDGAAHALHVGAPGYRVRAVRFQDAPPPRLLVLEPAPKRAAR